MGTKNTHESIKVEKVETVDIEAHLIYTIVKEIDESFKTNKQKVEIESDKVKAKIARMKSAF